MADFKDLDIWKESSLLAVEIYKFCEKLPTLENFGLSSQLQRASVIIPSNIAEGYRRNSKKDFSRFISIALGSAAELETQLYICKEVYSVPIEKLVNDTILIQRKLIAFNKSLNKKQ